MRYGLWLAAIAGLAVSGSILRVSAQGVGFLTEQQRLASYCAGVSESRMRDFDMFLKTQCAGSDRKECRETKAELDKAQVMDRRLWAYLTSDVIMSKEMGPREKAMSRRATAKGSDDWLTCKRRSPDQHADDLLVCRESQGCLIDSRLSFLPP